MGFLKEIVDSIAKGFKICFKGIGALFGIVLALIVIFALMGLLSGLTGNRTKNCKSDPVCFAEALQDCSKAKATLSTTQADMIYEITGNQGENCIVHYTTEIWLNDRTVERDCLSPKGQTLSENGATALSKLELNDCKDVVVS